MGNKAIQDKYVDEDGAVWTRVGDGIGYHYPRFRRPSLNIYMRVGECWMTFDAEMRNPLPARTSANVLTHIWSVLRGDV